MDLTGSKYFGKPVQPGLPKTGFEGATQHGELSFDKDRVFFILPGHDEKNSGTYQVSGNKLIIEDQLHGKHIFIIKKNGMVLFLGDEEFRRSDFPWPK